MTRHIDDTDLDALASQVRAFPRLDDIEMAILLKDAREGKEQAREKLVGHFLREALAASLERRDRGLDVADLYQEATVAVVAAIAEGADSIAEINTRVKAEIAAELDGALKQLAEIKRIEEQLVHDTSLLSAVTLRLKQEKRAEPTAEELATLLEWPVARVEVVLDGVRKAQAIHDLEILEYLDDAEDEEKEG